MNATVKVLCYKSKKIIRLNRLSLPCNRCRVQPHILFRRYRRAAVLSVHGGSDALCRQNHAGADCGAAL